MATQTNWTRREFVQTGVVLSTLAGDSGFGATGSHSSRAVIQILLVGGPSQLETWDPKPEAPSDIRGPFRTIATRIPGVRVSELFPQIAARLHSIALIRSMCHDQAPIHETGLKLVQGDRRRLVMPSRLGDTGVRLANGQEDAAFAYPKPQRDTARFGVGPFARSLAAAVDAVEAGHRHVVVNMFDTVFGKPSWDVHGVGGDLPTTFDDYARSVCPAFDRGFCALIDELRSRGLWRDVLVVATGEFGRSPRLNRHGGRDHWPTVWSALLAGGGICPGVYGRSDKHAAEPLDNPVPAGELAALMADYLGNALTGGLLCKSLRDCVKYA